MLEKISDEVLETVTGGSELDMDDFKRYECKSCQMKFSTKKKYDEHMRKQHDIVERRQ